MMRPRLDILPPQQKRLWPELSGTPVDFVLYGGTAIALRLGHRQSVDFDFFSFVPFVPDDLMQSVDYLAGGILRRSAPNTLIATVDRGGPVQVSFFGGLRIGRIDKPDTMARPAVSIASLLDLAGTKVAVVTQRAEAKDYIDIHALLTIAGVPLPDMLAAGKVIYGESFDPVLSLKAIGYHDDIVAGSMTPGMRRDLAAAVRKVDLGNLPVLAPETSWRGRS